LGGFSTVGLTVKSGFSRSIVSFTPLSLKPVPECPKITELTVLVRPQQQRPEMLAAATLAFSESADDKFLLG
jgi:hypothetical protein